MTSRSTLCSFAKLSLSLGNFDDAGPIGEGISELRIHYGPGYRLYYLQRDTRVVMLCGGDKSSQPRDIEKAKIIAKEWKD